MPTERPSTIETPADGDELITAGEVATLADVHVATVNRWARSGHLPIAKHNPTDTRRWYRRSDVLRIIFPSSVEQAS